MPKRLSSIIASSRCTQSTLVDFITWPMRSMVFFVSDADDDIYRIISGRVFLATVLSIWVLAEVRFTQFVITAIFRHKCCLKWCSDAFLKGTVAYIVWFFLWFWYCNWPLILRWKNYENWSACYHAIGTSTVSSSFRGHSVCCIMQIDADRYICY